MATSGVISFSQTAQSVITDALYNINALAPGESLENEDYELARRTLNRMLKNWQSSGIYIHTFTEAYLFITPDTAGYTIGASGTAHCTDSAVITELTAAAASGATTLSVVSTGRTVGDFIGIELDDGTRQWTTIATIPGATSVTITAALTDDAASGNTIFTYTTKSKWPLHIDSVRYMDYAADTERVLTPLTRSEYYDLHDKEMENIPSSYFYSLGNRTGTFYIWPVNSNVKDYCRITYQRVLHDVVAAGDDIDLPAEWLEPIVLNLAVRLAHPHRTKASMELRIDAKESLENAKRMNNEPRYGVAYFDSRS